MDFQLLINATADIFTGGSVLFLMAGIMIGLIFGVLPGLGNVTALALMTPFAYSMSSLDAMFLAGGIMGAGSFGGSVTAILLNTPGNAPNAATCFDGYPMARQGRAGQAIGASASASSLGGVIGVFTLLLFLPVARNLVLMFGPAEFFLLTLIGLATVALSARGNLLRGLIAACLGLLTSFIGVDPISGEERFTFGLNYLWDGPPLVPVITGLFAITAMYELAVRGGSISEEEEGKLKEKHAFRDLMEGCWASIVHWPVLLRGSIIGTVVGAIPGLGGTVAAFIAYTSTQQADRHPETYGKGNIKGVIAPEAANNAKDGGSLIPTMAFGIPGGAEAALFITILILKGVTPGPTMLVQNEREIYSLIVALTISSIGASIIGLALMRWVIKITQVNVQIIAPLTIAISLAGAYVLNTSVYDVVVCLMMGIVGYIMMRFDYPRLTFVIAMVLGEIAEKSFHQIDRISDQDPIGFMLGRPVSTVLIFLLAFVFVLPIIRLVLSNREKAKASAVS